MDDRRVAPPLTDLALLAVEAAMVSDARGRLIRMRGIKISAAQDGQLLFVGSDVPDVIVPALEAAVSSSPPAPAPDRQPPAIEACRAILEPALGPLALSAGPYYVFGPTDRPTGVVPVVRSDIHSGAALRSLNPGNWEPTEWDDLLDGRLGPWAIAVLDGRVISICHTSRVMTAQAAECGVWTHPDHRGRGYAAEVTATWAEIVRPSGRVLLYSTSAENLSSQRVAARLGLRLIGWTWKLASVNSEPPDDRHPLSRQLPA